MPTPLRVLLILLTGLLGSRWVLPTYADEVRRVNCESAFQRNLDLTPRDVGPLELKTIYCQQIRATPLPKSAPVVSPDGQWIAYSERDLILRVARLDGGKTWTDHQTAMGVFARFGLEIRSMPAFSWDATSTFLWAATQDKVQPSGFAKSGLRPIRTGENGYIQPLPVPHHDAGPLDALLWTGAHGLAVAQFGTRGGYYRPEHPDPDPLFAIVDAQRGIVLDTLPFDAIGSLKDRTQGTSPGAAIRDAAAVQLPDGQVRTLLSVGQWIVWTQGEAPRVITDPYAKEFNNRIAMSPDGSRVLVGRLLRTEGGICGRAGSCRPGKPAEGVLAALHDLETGRLLWSIRATVREDYEFPAPAISPDGRHALIGFVPDPKPVVALVAVDDGRVLQTIPSPGAGYAMGFTRGGKSVWTHANGLTAIYDIRNDTP